MEKDVEIMFCCGGDVVFIKGLGYYQKVETKPEGAEIKIPKLKLIEPNIDLEDAKSYSSPNEWHHDSLVYSGILDRKMELVTIPRTMLDEMIALLQEHGKGTKQKVLAMLKEVGK